MRYQVVVKPSGTILEVEQGQTFLEAALDAGVEWPFGCTRGMCGTCKARLLVGEVDIGETSSFALFDDERAAGYILTCSSRPTSNVEITFGDD
jgi:phenol hydroxylase P5 protein